MLSGDDFGEKHQPYSIESSEIPAFQSSYAIANADEGSWKVVTQEIVSKLALESKQRIDANPEFEEIERNLREAEENEGVIRLEEMLKKREEANQKTLSEGESAETEEEGESTEVEEAAEAAEVTEVAEVADESAAEEDEITPQLEEATNVLVDLIAFHPIDGTAVTATGVDPR